MYWILRIFILLGSAVSCILSADDALEKRASEASVQTVYTFPNGTVMENLAVRSNGQILVSIITAPHLYLLDPQVNSSVTLVHSFHGYECVFGIAELEKDQFYVLTGNASAETLTTVTGSWSAWKVDMTLFQDTASGNASNIPGNFVEKVADFPDTQFLNGLGVLSKENGLLYAADPFGGAINVLNVYSGHHYVAINNSYTIPGEPFTTPIGVNGVHVWQPYQEDTPYVFYTNTAQSILVRMPIHLTDGTSAGDPEIILSGFEMDDFTFDYEGNVLQAVIGSNVVMKINPHTKEVTVIGGSVNSTELAGPSAVQLGRLASDKDVAFVTLNGAGKVPGAVKMMDLGSLV
ncbi:hypothetical protein EV368DRAFT_75868 [Lentinula lateritia]|uniref:Uncharacterized protein n=1 Tax=Lentinula aff. lateritia TaxID=2804960 RepID=A0ACC1TKH9_9AGAR|nr:hypothetical protein F5876DRAFT_91609 [Lentinula aff. lateritia]KAJ3849121.1 hypothetical protein EV368DRAFT_75868 [Lentinula lateritia]